MRFIETLLVVIVAIYLAQLAVVILMLAALILFLGCLFKRPKEALLLGMGALVVAFLSARPGLALILIGGLALGIWALSLRPATPREVRLLTDRRHRDAL